MKQTFGSADRVGKLTVFNVGGNKVRIIAAIHYNRAEFTFVQFLLTRNMIEKAGKNDVK